MRIERVLSNLLNNAIKYSPRGGAVSVSVEAHDATAVVRVSDHGEGIPEQDLPHIFERFRRGGNVEHRIPGTGIGLAGARQIVELHRGTIQAESRVGEGSTFTVQLPLL
jgi:signal transduction histidine kinase